MRADQYQIAENMKRVTAGPGGEALLIIGEEKTALLECGMAFCGNQLVENIKKELPEGRTLNYIIISHSHYDHMGGLPFVKRNWPEAKVVGSQYAKEVFQKKSALKTIRELSQSALESYQRLEPFWDIEFEFQHADLDYRDEDIVVDYVVKEDDQIDLGGSKLHVMESPGHTNCCLSFYLLPEDIFFPAESMGCLSIHGDMMMSMLKGFEGTMHSIEKGERIGAKTIVAPHYGKVSEQIAAEYWAISKEAAKTCRDLVLRFYQSGASEQEIYQEYRRRYWRGIQYNQQPEEAFEVNAKNVIKALIREFNQKN